jgi:hypothetical protein
MGNAHSTSAEPPRRTSHKLSKPKTGNHATAGLLSPGAFSNNPRRLSNAPLPEPPPPPSSPIIDPTPTAPSAMEASAGFEQHLDNGAPTIFSHRGRPRESRRRSLFRSRSSRAAADTLQRDHSGGLGSSIVDRLTRASSMTYESAVAYYGQAGPDK